MELSGGRATNRARHLPNLTGRVVHRTVGAFKQRQVVAPLRLLLRRALDIDDKTALLVARCATRRCHADAGNTGPDNRMLSILSLSCKQFAVYGTPPQSVTIVPPRIAPFPRNLVKARISHTLAESRFPERARTRHFVSVLR